MPSASSRRAGARVILLSAELFIHWDIFQSAALMVFHQLGKKSSPSQNNPSESHSSSLRTSSTGGLGRTKNPSHSSHQIRPFQVHFKWVQTAAAAARRVLMMLRAHPTPSRAGERDGAGRMGGILSSLQSPRMFWGAQDRVEPGVGYAGGNAVPLLPGFSCCRKQFLPRNQALEEGNEH